MDISGNGIAGFKAKILPGYSVLQQPAISWRQVSSGNYKGLDRTSAEDIYEAQIGLYDMETDINNFMNQVEANRVAGTNYFTMAGFEDTEHIFGENVDHSTNKTVTIMNMERRYQGSLNGWGVSARVRLINPTFTGSASFPTLNNCDIQVNADNDLTIKKTATFDGSLTYHDHGSDAGLFSGVFTLSRADGILLLNYIRTQRTGDYTLSDTFGIDYPFGIRSTNSYPFTTKLIEWEDLGLWGMKYQKFSLTFSEEN